MRNQFSAHDSCRRISYGPSFRAHNTSVHARRFLVQVMKKAAPIVHKESKPLGRLLYFDQELRQSSAPWAERMQSPLSISELNPRNPAEVNV